MCVCVASCCTKSESNVTVTKIISTVEFFPSFFFNFTYWIRAQSHAGESRRTPVLLVGEPWGLLALSQMHRQSVERIIEGRVFFSLARIFSVSIAHLFPFYGTKQLKNKVHLSIKTTCGNRVFAPFPLPFLIHTISQNNGHCVWRHPDSLPFFFAHFGVTEAFKGDKEHRCQFCSKTSGWSAHFRCDFLQIPTELQKILLLGWQHKVFIKQILD